MVLHKQLHNPFFILETLSIVNTWTHCSLLGQLCVLHAWRADPDPAQSFPPYNGAGLVQVRLLSWVPPPHVTVHAPHDAHDAQLP